MTSEKTTTVFGWRVYGLGVMALVLVGLALGNFLPGQPAPKNLPDRTVLAYAVAVFMLVAGAAIEWRRSAAWSAAAADPSDLEKWSETATTVVLTGVAWLVADSLARGKRQRQGAALKPAGSLV